MANNHLCSTIIFSLTQHKLKSTVCLGFPLSLHKYGKAGEMGEEQIGASATHTKGLAMLGRSSGMAGMGGGAGRRDSSVSMGGCTPNLMRSQLMTRDLARRNKQQERMNSMPGQLLQEALGSNFAIVSFFLPPQCAPSGHFPSLFYYYRSRSNRN